MKRVIHILIITALICFPSGAYGQRDTDDDPIIKIFSKYEEMEGVETISISPTMFRLMNSRTNDQKTQELLSKITGLRIITLKDNDNRGRANRETFAAELQTAVKSGFEEIMMVRSAGERIELYVRNNPKSALLFITSSSNSVTAIHIAGTIDQSLIDAVMNGEIGISK